MKNLYLPQDLHAPTHAQTLTSILADAEGFTIFTKKEGHRWKQLGALPASEAYRIYDIIPKTEMVDLYFTINTYYRVGPKMENGLRKVYNKRITKEGVEMTGSRQEKNLQDLRCLYVDMDIYRNGAAINWRDASTLVMKMADKGIIPQPTLFANSGRGAYAIWSLVPHESKPADLLNYKAINRALNREFKSYSALLVPDGVFDAARVLRVPGSINSKAPDNPVTYVVQYDRDGKPYEYKLEEVAAKMSVNLEAPKPKPAPHAPLIRLTAPVALSSPANKPYGAPVNKEMSDGGKKGMKALGIGRMADLLEIIRAKGVFHGFRYKTLFILASTARIAGLKKVDAIEVLSDLATSFTPPYPGTDANDISVSEIVSAAYYRKIMKHTATGLATFFDLSTDECRSMLLKTIYTVEIAEIKRTPKRTNKEKLAVAITHEAPLARSLRDLCLRLFSHHAISLSKSQASRVARRLGLKIGQGHDSLAA